MEFKVGDIVVAIKENAFNTRELRDYHNKGGRFKVIGINRNSNGKYADLKTIDFGYHYPKNIDKYFHKIKLANGLHTAEEI